MRLSPLSQAQSATHVADMYRLRDGWNGRARTCDRAINSRLLYQLSYIPIGLARCTLADTTVSGGAVYTSNPRQSSQDFQRMWNSTKTLRNRWSAARKSCRLAPASHRASSAVHGQSVLKLSAQRITFCEKIETTVPQASEQWRLCAISSIRDQKRAIDQGG